MLQTPFPIPREKRQTEVLVGTGVASYGPFGFKIFDTADVTVWARPDGVDFFSAAAVAVAKVANAEFDDFTIDFGETVPATTQFVVEAARLHDRTVAVTKGGAISTVQLEKELSKQATVLEELRRDADKSLRLWPGQSGQTQLPVLADSESLAWDAANKGFKRGPSVTEIAAAQENAALALQARDDLLSRYLGGYSDDAAATAAAGDLIAEGTKYFNTTEGEERSWNGAGWVAGTVSAAMINTRLPTLIGDIDLTNPIFGAVRTGAAGTESANNTAFENAINEAKEQAGVHSQSAALIKVPSGVFRADEPIALDVDCARVVLRGAGSSATRIITPESEIDLLSVDGGTGGGLNDFGIAGIKFAYVGAEVDRTASANKKNEPTLVRFKNVLNTRLFDLEFEGGYNDLILHRVAHAKIYGLQHWKRATNYPAGYYMVCTSDASLAGGCTNIRINDVDGENRGSLAGGCEAGWLIETADGLLANDIHLIQCIDDVRVAPVGTANRDKVGGIFLTNFYADTCTQDAIALLGSGSNYGRIELISGYARDAGRDGVRAAASSVIDGLTVLPTFKIHSNNQWGFNCANANIKNHEIDADFKNNNRAASSSYGDINVAGTDYDIGGKYIGGSAAGTAINLGAGAGVGWVRGHNLDASAAGTKISDASSGGKINATRVYSGSYTPTLNNVTNISSSNAHVCSYTRIDDVVTVSGRVDVTPAAAGLMTLEMSLPYPPSSNFSDAGEAGGAGSPTSSDGWNLAVRAKTGAKIVELTGGNSLTAAHGVQFSFSYRIA